MVPRCSCYHLAGFSTWAGFSKPRVLYGALKVGNTKEEVVCALVHASAYMGIPRLFNALNTCKELLAEG